MKTSLFALAILLVGTAVQAESLSAPEKQFVEKASAGNSAEIKLAMLAQKKSQDSKVKDFANQMITDHGKANNDLKPIAEAANVKMSDQLKGEAKQSYDELAKLSGAKFDQMYLSTMLKDHEKDAAAYKKEQAEVKNSQLKTYVNNTLPVVEHHLTMVQKMAKPMASR
jgi:putative membrane protein